MKPYELSASKLPADYVSDLSRGTADFDPKWANYSYHKVAIPDGATLTGMNFSQLEPNTAAISGKGLTFIDCNLVNCALDPSWTIKDGNTAQVWMVQATPTQVDTAYIAAHPRLLTGQEAKPANVISIAAQIAAAGELP